MSRAAIPVMPPKTFDAIVSGRSVALADSDDVLRLDVDEWETLGERALHRCLHGREVTVAPLQRHTLTMSLLQQARSLFVRAGVNSMSD